MTAECKPVQVPNLERLKALENWLQKTKIQLIRINGQRKYGGPPEVWDGPTPGANCEIFICRIPREAYEDLLIPLFGSVAPLWEFRLMMNFSGQNRGFAFAKYGSPAIVAEAIRQLNGHVLEPGYRLLVCRSTEKKHLCIWNLPAKSTQEYLLQVLRKMVDGVENVSLRTARGRASALVAFSSHHAASMANKVLTEAFKKQFGLTVSIKWKTIRQRVHEDQAHEEWFPKNPFPDEPIPEEPIPEEPVPEEPVPEELCCSQKPAESPSPPKPQQYLPMSPQPSAPPPCPSHSPSFTPGFCKAVGGPAAPQYPKTFIQGPPGFTPVPVKVLYELCLMRGFGQPIYELEYSHTAQDGFLYFFYNVYVPGITAPFKGLITILPGPDASIMLEEAQAAAAQQVLQKFTA